MKLSDYQIGHRLFGGFFIMFTFTVLVGLIGIVQILHVASDTKKLYDHPLVVSNAVRDINTRIIAMHRTMKDIALTRDTAKIDQFYSIVENYEHEADEYFDLVSERFLGNQQDVQKAHEAFLAWRPIRQEVIGLSRQGKWQEAAEITRGKGAEHVSNLEKSMRVMVDFASLKAASFLENAQQSKKMTIFWMVFLLASTGLCGLLISILIPRSITIPLKQIVERIREIADGVLDKEVNVNQKDEIGYLADSLRDMQSNLQEKATLAQQIAHGNFSKKIETKSQNDSVALSINQIIDNFSEVVDQANMIADGDYSVTIRERDKHNELTVALNRMFQSLKEVVDRAKQIAEGDYSGQMELRSTKDELAPSLNKMTNALREKTAANDQQSWLKSGLNDLNETIRGEFNQQVLVQSIITFLVKHLQLPIGIIYLLDHDNNKLQLAASYACSREVTLQDTFAIGEGLVGQAALEKEVISVSKLPDDYLKITSGLGTASPVSIVVAPFSNEDQLLGVIELGSLEELSSMQIEFINSVLTNIAVAINSAQSRQREANLLAKTQEQAETLQSQQEELQQSNEELEEQTKALKESEAQLQQQQEELRVANEELVERTTILEDQGEAISRKNKELEKARSSIAKKAAEVEQASRYKSEFLANMSHELRTPLNSILLLSRLLFENKGDNLSDKQLEYARTINSSGTDLLELINEILDLSKIEAGHMEIHLEAMNLFSFLDNSKQSFSQLAIEKGLDLTTEINETVPRAINTDRQRVEQIVRNLLSNAFKFTDQGSISLSISRPESTIDLSRSGLAPENAIAIRVTDSGTGIPPEKQAVIFEAFQQADGTISRKFGGTGLGLSISRELARILGGEIQMTSEPDKGSTFTLYLPERHAETKTSLTDEQQAPPKETLRQLPTESHTTTKPPKPSLNPIEDDRNLLKADERCILIIEDDTNFCKVIRDLAAEKGFKSLIALNGENGFTMAVKHVPTAIILDINLPGIDGWTVMERLKENPQTRHIPVHFISVTDKELNAMRMGAVGFLTKPVSPESLNTVFTKFEEVISKSIKKLLVVEDDQVERAAIKELIGNGDVHITTVPSAEEAFKYLKSEHFDCMILDLRLDGMSGYEFLAIIRQDKSISQIPIIVYTGKDLTADEEEEIHKYAESIIIKGARSPERLLAETTLFLHRVEADLPEARQKMLRMVHDKESVFSDKKILIVDDDMRNVFAITSVLEEKGITVIAGRNGRDGLDKLFKNPATDLVLMDIMMPEMDGLEAMQKIRQHGDFNKLPIIALTAKAMAGDHDKCLSSGANDYLAKPVDMEKLLSMMRVWLYQ